MEDQDSEMGQVLRTSPENGKVKLHLGCGKRNIPGFINVDLANFPHIHYKQDVKDLSNFDDDYADYIYASHVLEYFDRFEAREALGEWYRVLKPGGLLRVSVPDIFKLIWIYQKTKDLNLILGPLYGKMGNMYHKTVYDYKSLKELLEAVGFRDVVFYNWKETLHKDYDDHSQAYFPHMDKEKGLLISLNFEATK